MISEAGLYPIIFAFSILLVFLHRFYQRYMRPCIARGSKQQVFRGLGLITFSVTASVVLRILGY